MMNYDYNFTGDLVGVDSGGYRYSLQCVLRIWRKNGTRDRSPGRGVFLDIVAASCTQVRRVMHTISFTLVEPAFSVCK